MLERVVIDYELCPMKKIDISDGIEAIPIESILPLINEEEGIRYGKLVLVDYCFFSDVRPFSSSLFLLNPVFYFATLFCISL